MKQDQDGDITDILTSEGEKGWLEKVLKKVKSNYKRKTIFGIVLILRQQIVTYPIKERMRSHVVRSLFHDHGESL